MPVVALGDPFQEVPLLPDLFHFQIIAHDRIDREFFGNKGELCEKSYLVAVGKTGSSILLGKPGEAQFVSPKAPLFITLAEPFLAGEGGGLGAAEEGVVPPVGFKAKATARIDAQDRPQWPLLA